MKRAILIHLYEGYPEYSWYPETKRRLEELGFKVEIPSMPNPNSPKLHKWIMVLKKMIQKPDENMFLIGHSIGAVTILRHLENLHQDEKVGGVVLVAGFTDDMGYEVFSNFFTSPLRLESIKNKAKSFTIIVSDDDPYVDMKYGYELSKKLNGKLIIKKNMKHMSKDCIDLPEVAEAIKEESKYEKYIR